ncbi:MAG: hypothetical protein ABI467_13370 [Kofleriaceae bacterium]
MRGRFRAVASVVVLSAGLAAASPAPEVRVPPGTRKDHTGELVSARGLRETTAFLAKELDRRGIPVEQIGPTRTRGVELVRFLSQAPSTPWLAIHVLRTNGKTVIFFVPRAGS